MKNISKQQSSNNTQNKKQVQALYDSYAKQYTLNYLNPTSLFGMEKQHRLRIVRDYLQELQPSSVLDLGCGPGYTTSIIAKDLSNATVLGMDFSPEMIDVAGQNYAQKALFLQGDVENLPFEDEHFSAIFALGLLEKFENPRFALNECYRVLTSGGQLYFTYPNRNSLLTKARRRIESILENRTEAQCANMLSVEAVLATVNAIGFKVLDVTFLTYGNSFVLFPWSARINLVMEKYLGKNNIGRAISLSSFWALQKFPHALRP